LVGFLARPDVGRFLVRRAALPKARDQRLPAAARLARAMHDELHDPQP
jgi:hypothetical protein